MDREVPDMEPLTDLAMVFWGLGIFNANSAAQSQQHDDGTKQGWAKHLRLNVGNYFRQSLKVLEYRDAQKNKQRYGRM